MTVMPAWAAGPTRGPRWKRCSSSRMAATMGPVGSPSPSPVAAAVASSPDCGLEEDEQGGGGEWDWVIGGSRMRT